jgi:predicted transcriptional regulator
MSYLALLGNPWCVAGALLTVVLLLTAAALRARERAYARPARPTQRLEPRPQLSRSREITATAPFEALSALRERLAELQRHLPVGSEDARWLAGYRHDLGNVIDDMYWEVYRTEGAARVTLLEQLSVEVGRLDRTISTQLSTAIGETTDRAALHAQLDHLRRTLND